MTTSPSIITIHARDLDGLYLIERDGRVVRLASRGDVRALLHEQGYRRDVVLSIVNDLSTADSGVAAVTFVALAVQSAPAPGRCTYCHENAVRTVSGDAVCANEQCAEQAIAENDYRDGRTS